MFRIYAVLLGSVLAVASLVQAQPKILWTTTRENSTGNIGIHDAIRDYSGNTYMITNYPTTTGYTLVLLKYSNVGSLIKETPIPLIGNFGYQMTADKSGNVYIVVNDEDKIQTLMKYSPNGDSLWSKKMILELPDGDYRAENRLIAIDGDGNVCIASKHYIRKPDAYFRSVLMVSSYSPSGELRWKDTTITQIQLDRETEYGDLELGEIMVDASNNIVVAVMTRAVNNPAQFIGEVKIVKYSGSGSGASNPPMWIRTFAENSVSVEFSDMDIDEAGNIFVAYNHFISFQIGGAVRKYNAGGSLQWEWKLSNSSAKIAADHNGGVYAGVGRSLSITTIVSRIFHFTQSDSMFIGNFGYGNFSMLTHLAVDKAGFVAASGLVKQFQNGTEGSYYFMEYTPSGMLNGAVLYSTPGVSYEFPYRLFQGNGTYTVLGTTIYTPYSEVLWLNKISVVPNPPAPPDPQPEKGWATQNSGTTADLYSVWFKQGSEGWAVGDSGTILHTMDAGNIWTKVPSPVQSNFKEIRFFNDTLGFIVGTGGIIRTTDRGATWTKISETGEQTLYAIAANDSGWFLAVGTGGLGRYSTDWGNTWSTTNTINGETLRDVEHFGGLFIAAGDNASVFAWPTISGWATINSGALFGQHFRAIQKNGKKLQLYGSIIGEVDEKLTFRSSVDFPPTTLLSVADDPKGALAIVTGEMGTIGFAEDERSVRYKTISPNDLNDVFQSGSFAVVVGEHGTIINYNNRFRVSNRPNDIFFSLTMIDPMTYIYSSQKKLFRSIDGGNLWSIVDSSGLWSNRFAVNGSVVWGSVKIDSQYIVMRSQDKGATWNAASPLASLKQLPVITTLNGTTALLHGTRDGIHDQTVFTTMNSGTIWVPIDTVKADHQSRFHMADSLLIWREDIDLTNDIYSLRKRGATQPEWLTVYSDSVGNTIDPYDAVVLPKGEVILTKHSGISKPMFHTVNGGMTWKKYPSSISSAEHLEHRTFANRAGFDLHLSTDGNFTHKIGPDYFFTLARGGYRQGDFGGMRQFVWMEDDQIVFEHPLQIDTSRIIDRWMYLASQRKKAIGNPTVAADTIIVAPGSTGNVLKNIVVLADRILHTAIGDLTIVLSHNGVSDTLFHQLGFSADNMFNVVFSDASTSDLAFVRAPFSGEFRPFSPLEKFIGSDPSGAWILKIYDKSPADSGMLESWSLKLESDHVVGVQNAGLIPSEFALSQNYPNPFNPATTINFQLPMNSMVSLKVYDVLGREVTTLVNDVMIAGSYSMPFDASRFASGVYFYRIDAAAMDGSRARFIDVRKMILLK